MKGSSPITLARWDTANGSSRGWWLVRQVPGLIIFNSHYPGKMWCIGNVEPEEKITPFTYGLEARLHIWGENPDLDSGRLLLEQNPGLKTQGYKTREAARIAIETALSDCLPHKSSLGKALSA